LGETLFVIRLTPVGNPAGVFFFFGTENPR